MSRMNAESIICNRTDKEIVKTILIPGDYTLVPYEDSRCKIILSNVKCKNENGADEIEPQSRIFGNTFDGNVIIGDMDCYIDKDVEVILQQMCCGETSRVRITYNTSEGVFAKKVSFNIHLVDVTEEQLISDWSWARLYEASLHHKDRGVQLVKDKKLIEAFRRFSKSMKMLVAIEPIDTSVIDAVRVKEMQDVKVKLYNNLAHCQLQFEEFGAALDLCSRALKYDLGNVKALYRRSIAYVGLNMYLEAWCDLQHALAIDPNNKAAKLKAQELRPQVEKMNKEYTTVIKKMFD